jgi:hypothetical protein
MKKHSITLIIIAGFICLGSICCRPTEETDTFYLRSIKTGKLIGPISLTPGHTLPQLDEQMYIVADPTDSELKIRKCLLEIQMYESHYIDYQVDWAIDDINRMLKHRHGDNVPPVRYERIDGFLPDTITMDLFEVPMYDALCDIAAKTKLRIFIEDGAVLFSAKPLRETANKHANIQQ